MLGLFYNKMESSQDENSKVSKKRGTTVPANARYGRHQTVEAGKSAGSKNDQQALKSQGCRYRARNEVSVVVQSITDQGASSFSQTPGSPGQFAAQASSAGLNGQSEGSANLKQVKHSQSLPHRDASAGSPSRSRGKYDRSGALQSKIQMKHTQSLLANKVNKHHPLIMEISPDPKLPLQQRPIQLSQANKAQIKLVNRAGGTARSVQAQLNGNLLKTKQKWNPDESLRPVQARNNRSSAERLEAKKANGKRKNASSSLVGSPKAGRATEPGLHIAGLTPDGLSRVEAQAKATTLQTETSFANAKKTEGNNGRVAPDTARNFNPVATPLHTSQVENDRIAGLAATQDSRIWSDSSDPRSSLQPTRNKTSKPRPLKREKSKKVPKKHMNSNTHALSMSPSQMRPDWRKGKTPLIQTVKYRAEPNNNKGSTNFPVYANEFGQSHEGGIQSSPYIHHKQDKDNLCNGSNAPMLNQQTPSMSPLRTPLSGQNAVTYQQQRPVQPTHEQQRAPIPPMINITRKTIQSPPRGAEFRKTLTEIGDKSKKQFQASNHVSDGDIAAVHNQKNMHSLRRISEIAEEQPTHAASLAGMPIQNLVEEKGAPFLVATQTDDRHQALAIGKPKQQLSNKPLQPSGLPSQTHRTNLDGQLSKNPRGDNVQILSHEEDLCEASSIDGTIAPLQQSSLITPNTPRRQEGEIQHKDSYDPVNTAMLQSINANSGSVGSRQIYYQDGVDRTASQLQNVVNRTAYFNESSEAMGTPQSRHEVQQLRNEKSQEKVPYGSPEEDVAPGPGDAEPGCQRTRITIVTAPTARKQQRQTPMGPAISNSQDASMFRSQGSIGASVPMRNSDYGQTLQARTEDHRGPTNTNYQDPASKTFQDEPRDTESAQNASPRFNYRNSVEYQAGQTSKDTFLSGGEKSAQNQLRFTLADSANADDQLASAKGMPSQVDDSPDPIRILIQPGSYETQDAGGTPNKTNKKQVRIGSTYSSVDQAALSRPELISISNQGKPILQVKTKQFKPNQVEPSQGALGTQPQHLKSKSLPEAAGIPEKGSNIMVTDQAARKLAQGTESDEGPQLQETGGAHDDSSSQSDSEGTDLDNSSGADGKDGDGKDDDMGDAKMRGSSTSCTGKISEMWADFLFRPSSSFKIKWDIIVIILSVWNSIEIPFEFAFPESFDGATTIYAMDKVIDALFVFDILVNFRTMYVDPRTDLMVEDPKRISKNYVQGRFWIDLVASIPFEVFAVFLVNDDGTSGNETTLKVFGMLKLVRLMRLGRMVSFMKTNKSFKLGIILVQLLFILILVIHWLACVWYGVIGLEGGNTWIPPKDVDWDSTIIYTETDFQVYNVFFYYSVLTLVTNELMPTNNIEILSAIGILLTGSLVIGILIGEFSSIMSDMSETANRQNEELDMMTSVMMGLKLPEEIQLNVLDYYLSLQSCKYVHNDEVYEYLNKCITNTVKHFQVETWVIRSQLVHPDNQSLILQFASLTTMEYFQQNEIIIKQNDLSDNFYLICEGIVEVAQEARDFQYYDYHKKKRFLERQVVINQRRRKASLRNGSRKAGVQFDEITQFQNVMDIKPFFSNSKDSREEDGSGGAGTGLPTANQEETAVGDTGFRIIKALEEGDYFGEVSLVTNLRRTCSVYTVSNGYFAVIAKAQFLELANANVDLKQKLYDKIATYQDENFKTSVTMIRNVPQFRTLDQRCLRKIVYRLRDERFARGQKILRTGENCDKVYFVRSGRVQVYVKDMTESSNARRWHRLTTLKAGDCFNFVGAVLQRPAIFEFVSESLPGVGAKTEHGQGSAQRESRGFTEQQLEESEASYRDSERSQDDDAVEILSGDGVNEVPGESQPLGAGTNEAALEAKYEGGQPEAPGGTGVRSQPKRAQPSNDGQRHLPPTDSARWQSAGLGSQALINSAKLDQPIGAEAGLGGRASPDIRVSDRSGTRHRNGHKLGSPAGSIGQAEPQARSKPRQPKVVQATSRQKAASVSAGSQPNSISRMISRSLNFSQEPGENENGAAPHPGSSEADGAAAAAAEEEQARGDYEVLDNTAQLYSLSRGALMELADMDEHIHNAIVNVKNVYRGQHLKYDYSNLLYKNTKELTVAQHAKDMQEYNEFGELDSHFFFCTSFIQKLKMQMLRKKILRFAKFMLQKNIKMNDVEVFKHVDANYHRFVGRDKNLPLNLILHNGFYNQTSQGKLFKFIERINEKNLERAKTAPAAENMDERDLNMNKDKSVFDNEKEYSQFSKQTALNVNTLRRYKEQEHFQQNLINKPTEALERILEQALENVQNVDIVRQNVEELHFENYYKLTQLEKWVDKIATQYRTVVRQREGSDRLGAAGLQARQLGQAAGSYKERQGHQALTSACAGSTSQTLKPLPESAEYRTPSQGAENDNMEQDFAVTSPEKTKAMTLAEFKEIEKQAEDLDIDSMLRDVEDIEKKIRKTINQSVAEQEKISVERQLTERHQRHAVDSKQYYDSGKEKSASPGNRSNNYQKSQTAAGGTEAPEGGSRFTNGTQNNGSFQDKHGAANVPERGRSQEPKKVGQSREPNRQPTHSSRGAHSKESDCQGPVEIVASPKVGKSIKRETNAAFHSPRRHRGSGGQGTEDANGSFHSSARTGNDRRGPRPGQQINSQVSIAASNVLDQSGSLQRNAAAAGPAIPSSTLRSAALAGLGNVPNLNNANVTYNNITNESGQHSIGEPRASQGSQHPGASGGRQERTARVDLDLNKFYSDTISQANAADAAESRFVHTLDSQPSHRSHNPSFSFQVAADGKAGSPSPADRARVIKTQSSRDSQYVQYKK